MIQMRGTPEPESESETEVETVEIPLETIATVAFSLAPEVLRNEDVQMALPDGAENESVPPVYELRDDFEDYETITDRERGWGIRFLGRFDVGVTYRTSRGSYWHPPEYDTDYYEMGWSLAFYPGDNDGFGSALFEVDHL